MNTADQTNPTAIVRTRLAGFIDTLRRNGFQISTSDTHLAHQVCCTPFIETHLTFRAALSAVFCRSKRDRDVFKRLFNRFWFSSIIEQEQTGSTGQLTANSGSTAAGLAYFSETEALQAAAPADPNDLQEVTAGGASDARVMSQRDFRFVFNPKDMRVIEFMVDALARNVQRRARRRSKASLKSGTLDIRRTARASCQHGGWPFSLYYRQKRKTPPRFMLLLDVSQSMEIYSYLFLRFARGLLQAFSDIDAYAFHTDLIPIGNELKDKNTARLETKLKNLSSGWLGGTRIAESLEDFNKHHANTLNRNTIVLIFSDGYDSSEPQELVNQVLLIKDRARKLVWVNPLLGRNADSDFAGDKPSELAVDQCMNAVLPHLDLYTSAHNLDTLKNLAPAFSLR